MVWLTRGVGPVYAASHVTVMAPDSEIIGTLTVREFGNADYMSLTQWADSMDADLEWDFVTGVAEMRFRDQRLRWVDGGRGAWINGRMQSLEGPARQQEGDFWIPLSLLDVLVDPLWNGDLTWNPNERILRRLTARIGTAPQPENGSPDDRPVIVLDPGHGGDDNGCLHPGGSREKDAVLTIAGRLAEVLTNRMGARVVLTRPGDYYVSPDDRIAVANRNQADLFISLHMVPGRDIPGKSFMVYTLPREASAAHAGDLIPWEYRSEETVNRTAEYVRRFGDTMAGSAAVPEYGFQVMDLRVLKGLAMPGFMVEMGWESAFYGDVDLTREGGLHRASEAILDGIRSVYESEAE